MDGILIFNQSNDLIYKKFNSLMNDKIRELALSHELVEKESVCLFYQFLCNFSIKIFVQ